MSTERTRETMTAYLDSLLARGEYARYLRDDVVFTVMGTDQEVHGRVSVEQFIRYLHEVAFDAHPTLVSLVVEDRKAMGEFEFRGTHIAEFAGQAASGKAINLPYSVAYDVEDDKITALRAYISLDSLIRQITTSPEAAQAVA